MKMRRQVILMLLIIALLCTSAYAENFNFEESAADNILRSSLYINTYNASITAESDGIVAVDTIVIGTGIMTVIGVKTLNIQKYQSGSWTTVKTYSSLYAYNSTQASSSVTYQGTAGYQYRAVVTFYASNSSGYDTRYMTTSSVIAVS
ncbi:MAG: hypothetical protein ACOX7P_08395 [Oscillospiraceae bacterium]|jgi:hypothetical protein